MNLITRYRESLKPLLYYSKYLYRAVRKIDKKDRATHLERKLLIINHIQTIGFL